MMGAEELIFNIEGNIKIGDIIDIRINNKKHKIKNIGNNIMGVKDNE